MKKVNYLDTEDSDNDDTNENTIKSQVDQAKQTKTQIQRNINKDKTNAQWYEATKLLKTRWVSGKPILRLDQYEH
jgi:hypothetical protein